MPAVAPKPSPMPPLTSEVRQFPKSQEALKLVPETERAAPQSERPMPEIEAPVPAAPQAPAEVAAPARKKRSVRSFFLPVVIAGMLAGAGWYGYDYWTTGAS